MSLAVATIAGSAGAAVRYVLSGLVQRKFSSFPAGTAAVNVLGALGIGLVAGLADPDGLARDIGIGFLGGFTTFSTWMVESVGLGLLPRPSLRAFLNVVGVLAAGVCLAALGYTLTE